jgi:isoquinoline 1-oxidoreductase beta subunit
MSALIGPDRTIDFKGVDYPNYGASLDSYPWETMRLRRVTEMVAEKSGWAKRKLGKGKGIGIAAHRSFLTYVASVVEVEVSDDGTINLPRVDTVVDAGLVVNPEARARSLKGQQCSEPALLAAARSLPRMGSSSNPTFPITPVARINEAPYQTNVYLVDSDAPPAPPAGVGEPGVPPFIPALCNAIFAATGTTDPRVAVEQNKLRQKFIERPLVAR